MRLFHSSSEKLSVLEPMLGDSRHKGEDPRAIDKPVLYLTTAEDEIFSYKDKVAQYKYVVEIDDDDTNLFLDEKDYEFMKECNEEYPEMQIRRWYFSLRPIQVTETFEWDVEKYVKRQNF